MHIYRFKITHDKEKEFLREIEIKSTSSFEEFHYAILKSLKFDGKELASFYICDDKFDKQKEITLIDMMEDDSEAEDKPDIMHKAVIENYIESKGQKLIYEYDFLNLQTFYIKLADITAPDKNATYPRCITSKGKIKIKDDLLFMDTPMEDFNDEQQTFPEEH